MLYQLHGRAEHLATDCSLLPATFQHLRFGMKFIFSSKIEIIDYGRG
jgi:hypothetical protein